MRQLVYTEWVTDLPTPAWAYNPPMRHDEPIAQIVESLQQRTLSSIFSPILLQRLDDLSLKYGSSATMSLSDAFAWSRAQSSATFAGRT